MTMASRDIANMHLFLDLKKKFPDLPDDTLRNYVSLFAEDQEKCINLLQKESENHYHPSQPFSDFHLPESKVNSKRNDNVRHFIISPNESSNSVYPMHSDMPTFNQNMMPSFSGRSSSHAGVVHLPRTFLNTNVLSKPESLSAPVITSSEKPFIDMYKENSVSSHSTLCQTPNEGNSNNQIMFSTTKEHKIEPPECHQSTEYLISAQPEQSKRHAVRLNITPSFPFQQQHVNVYNSSVCATASHSSRPGRHTTTLNFQLQPQSSNQFPLEISTIPRNVGDLCNSRDFGSHVQISVGSQGATFTAVRLQRPNCSQTQNVSHLPTTEESPHEYAMSSSQVQNSNVYVFPDRRVQHLPNLGTNDSFRYLQAQDPNNKSRMKYPTENLNSQFGSVYHASPDYILAVKNHQIAQLDLILNELEKEKSFCAQLRAEVNRMEKEIAERNNSKSLFPFAGELDKLREENKRLRTECNCLCIEAGMCSSSEVPPCDKDDFYTHIFTGPNGAITSDIKVTPKKNANLRHKSGKPSFEDDEDDERNRWICKKCTFANHPALEKCEMCELPKDIEYIECNSGYSPSTCLRFVSSSKDQPQRAVGSIQISVTRRVPSSSKSMKLHLTHRLPR